MKILFTGGGSGGHIFPVLAIIKELKKQNKEKELAEPLHLYFVGPKSKHGFDLLQHEGVIIKTIEAGKIRRYLSPKSIFQNIIDVSYKIPISFIHGFSYLKKIQPDLVFSKGGYGSVPINWAARKLKIPIFIHESDIVPGKSTKMFAQSATKIFTSFKETKIENLSDQKIVYTGNPIRKEILNGRREEAKKIFKLTDQKPVLLITGGSQGAERINNLILVILPDLLKSFEIIHQCGDNNIDEIWSAAQIIVKQEGLIQNYHPIEFITQEKLKHAFAISHLIVSRAGANAIFEFAAMGKPSILLPLPEAAQDHQGKNAYAYAANGAALIMEQKNPTPALLYKNIMSIFSKSEKLKTMSSAALNFAKLDAAEIIAQNILLDSNKH
ncbi:MAG: UDP-N-acetylglucosamine--N-acetylmuramyl-(pentapeptide) pyrophosphoryl-undecaprenol N-acetylglucosamine transferase [Patescibacteria group bacterium]|nr:UDP-N-acetylglucosamine--N-acetylmuramyl-(pentapeptide) pyrophosphoryl-undecaprenol N-acetylglucosamine transferase [Patescibacteria group bacterium]